MTDSWLYGWKSIAEYLGCSVSTAKKYHYSLGMPVLRKIGNPRAQKVILDEWFSRTNEKTSLSARQKNAADTLPHRKANLTVHK